MWRRTCTSHVQCKPLHRSSEPQGPQVNATIKAKTKIINQSTHFINEWLYMHYLTVMSPVRRLKKLFSYYSII